MSARAHRALCFCCRGWCFVFPARCRFVLLFVACGDGGDVCAAPSVNEDVIEVGAGARGL